MRKILLLSLLSLLAFAACKKDPQYEITGKVTGGDMVGKTVYLRKLDKMRPTGAIIDSTVIASDSTFKMKGSVEHPDMYNLSISGERIGINNFFVENTPIQVTLDVRNPQESKASSAANDLFNNYMKEVKDSFQERNRQIQVRAQELIENSEDKSLTEEQEAELNKEFDQLMEDYKNYQVKFINDNPNSIVSAWVFRTISNNLTPEEVEAMLAKFDPSFEKSFFISSVKEDIETQKKVAVGQKFIDIKLPNPEGQEIALSDYAGKGKYVLVDFWASWCGPCRKENPNVVALYEKYKDKGFEIVGVSLDRDKAAWVKGIEDDQITWPQMSDLKFWESAGAQAYGIKSIPSTVLLDKDGTILAKNLYGKDLEAKVAELIDGE